MAISEEFLSYVLDRMFLCGCISVRRMFGGAGLFREGRIFGVVANDAVFLKVDDSNREDFLRAGSAPFNPYPDKVKTTVRSYYEIPPGVLEDPEELALWIQRSLDIGGSPRPRSQRTRKSGGNRKRR